MHRLLKFLVGVVVGFAAGLVLGLRRGAVDAANTDGPSRR